jgi:hypothetical protein
MSRGPVEFALLVLPEPRNCRNQKAIMLIDFLAAHARTPPVHAPTRARAGPGLNQTPADVKGGSPNRSKWLSHTMQPRNHTAQRWDSGELCKLELHHFASTYRKF